jgi:predicted branched-subunit amino acid permease
MRFPPEMRAGLRSGVPLIFPSTAAGLSFGVLAQPVMGSIAPVVMSLIVCSGAAQFASLTVLMAGGGAAPAITAGMLLNARWLPMGLALGPYFKGGPLRRALESWTIVDASFAIASKGDGTYSRERLIGATIPQAGSWIAGTIIGVLGGSLIRDPEAFGLDAMFPAFFAFLLFDEAHGRFRIAAATLGGLIAFAVMPFAPVGIPVVAASVAALIGLRQARALVR